MWFRVLYDSFRPFIPRAIPNVHFISPAHTPHCIISIPPDVPEPCPIGDRVYGEFVKKLLLPSLGLAVIGGALAGCQATRAGYATAPYRVLRRDGPVELREYPALQLAETPRGGDDFMRLFHYISKDNTATQKIAMTTPVFMTDVGSDHPKMAFVLPEKLGEAPSPKNQTVAIRQSEPGTFAVLRFHGKPQGPTDEAATQLRQWLATHDLLPLGDPQFAYFDPPWIPGIFCRNEVMIRSTQSSQPVSQ